MRTERWKMRLVNDVVCDMRYAICVRCGYDSPGRYDGGTASGHGVEMSRDMRIEIDTVTATRNIQESGE